MGLNIVKSDPLKLSSFDVTQQFLGILVANQANHNCIKNDERGISTVETFKKSNKLKKGKGRKGTGGKRLEDRSYPKDEWNRIISGLVTRQPRDEELEDFSSHIEMTSSEEWDPYSIDYALAEKKLQNDDTQTRSWNISLL